MSEIPYESVPLEDFAKVFKETSTGESRYSTRFGCPSLQKVTRIPWSSSEVSSVALGGKIVSFSDEFFVEASNLLKVHPSVNMARQFGPKGALYDGWETRRHNAPNHDWVIIRLGSRSLIKGFDIDTSHFNGNEGPASDVQGLVLEGDEKQLAAQEKLLMNDDPRVSLSWAKRM